MPFQNMKSERWKKTCTNRDSEANRYKVTYIQRQMPRDREKKRDRVTEKLSESAVKTFHI